jgi:hypothetical protein
MLDGNNIYHSDIKLLSRPSENYEMLVCTHKEYSQLFS